MPWRSWQSLRSPRGNGRWAWSGASSDSIDGLASTNVPSWPLLVEVVRAVRRKVGHRIRRLTAVAVLEVDVRPGRVPGGALVTNQLTLVNAVAGFDNKAEQVTIQGEEVVAVRDDHVVAVTDQLAAHHAGAGGDHDPVVGGQDRAALVVGDVNPSVKVRVAESRGLECLGAGTKEQRDRALLQRPDQRVFGGVGRTGTWEVEQVVLHPELRLLPRGLLGLRDQLILSRDLHIGNPLRKGGRLTVDGDQLVLDSRDALLELVLEVLLVRLLLEKRRLLGDQAGALLVRFTLLRFDKILLRVQLLVDEVDVLDQLVTEEGEMFDRDRSVQECLEVRRREQLREWVGVALVGTANERRVLRFGPL